MHFSFKKCIQKHFTFEITELPLVLYVKNVAYTNSTNFIYSLYAINKYWSKIYLTVLQIDLQYNFLLFTSCWCNSTVIAIDNVCSYIMRLDAQLRSSPTPAPKGSSAHIKSSKTGFKEVFVISHQRSTLEQNNKCKFCPFSWCEDDLKEAGAFLLSLPGATKGCETSHGGFR